MVTALDARVTQAVQGAVLSRQRRLLTDIGRGLGFPVVFLKGAWSDAALWGDRGARRGCDLDALVPAGRFDDFARALEREGFTRWFAPRARLRTAASRAWTFTHPGPWRTVDLHRDLGVAPWFPVDSAALIARAVDWPSPSGPVRALCPEDQILHLALHHAAEFFSLDDRHARDVARMLSLAPVRWPEVFSRAREARADLALALALDAARALGADAPDLPWRHDVGFATRESLVRRWLAPPPALHRAAPHHRYLDPLLRMPALSGAWASGPRFVARWSALRAGDALLEALTG